MSALAVTTVDLARIQFATTSLYHFLFVPLTLGLAPLVAVMQTMWHRTGNDAWLRLTRFFGTLHADQLRHRRRHRARAGVPVRHELVDLLGVRRRRLRRAARHRGAGGVHARVDLPGPLDLRLEQARSTPPSGDRVAVRARELALGLLHHGRQLVDAAPCRLRHRGRQGRADQHLGAAHEPLRDLGVRARGPRRADDRGRRRLRRRLLALPARPQRRGLPPRRQAGADRPRAGLGGEPGDRQSPRCRRSPTTSR